MYTQMNRRVPLLLTPALAGVFLFLSCTPRFPDDEKRIIEYVSMWTEGEPQALYLKELGDSFLQDRGYRIQFTFAGREVLTSIRGRILMEDPPDLVDQDLSELNGAFLGGKEIQAEDLTDLFYKSPGPEGQNRLIDIFYERAMDLYKIGDRVYFFPYELITSGFFYNKQLFEEKDLSVPEDWDSFMDLCFRLKIKGFNPLALDGSIPYYNAYYYYWFLSRLIDPEAFIKAVMDRSGETWQEDDYLMAARYVASLSDRHYAFFQDGYQRSIFPLAQKQWASNESAFILCGSWIPSETEKYRKFTAGYFPFPNLTEEDKRFQMEAYLIGCAIPLGADNREGAEEFLQYMIRRENSRFLVEKTGNISARKDIPYPEALKDIRPYITEAEQFHIPYGGVLLHYPEWFSRVFNPLNDALVFGEISPVEFIDELQRRSVRYWKDQD